MYGQCKLLLVPCPLAQTWRIPREMPQADRILLEAEAFGRLRAADRLQMQKEVDGGDI